MLTKTRALVLRCTPYGEHAMVARFLTRELGAYSYMLYGIRSKKSRITPAMLHPMALLEAEVLHKPDSDLQRIPELQPLPFGLGGYGTAGQLLAAGLIAEVLSQAVHDHDPQPDLFDWLVEHMEALMLAERPAEHTLAVLTDLPGWLGFSVDATTYRQGSQLNFADGVFVGHDVSPTNTRNWDGNLLNEPPVVSPPPHSTSFGSQDHTTSNGYRQPVNQPASFHDSSKEGNVAKTNATQGDGQSRPNQLNNGAGNAPQGAGQSSPIRQSVTDPTSTGAPHSGSLVHSERSGLGFNRENADSKSSYEMAFYLSKNRWPDNFQCSEAYLQALYGLYARHLPSFRIPRSHSMFCCLVMK